MAGTALVVIDMLVDFVEEAGKLYCGPAARAIIPRVQEEIDRARERGETVIYLCDRHRPDDSEFELFPPHCVEGTRGAEVSEELAPHPGDRVIAKRRFSGFAGTDLDLTLREKSITRLRLTGVCTNICVLYTAADARMLGYEVEAVADAVASFDAEAHRWALRELEKTLGARLIGGKAGGASE
jgi:nicotinamidase-related amidase